MTATSQTSSERDAIYSQQRTRPLGADIVLRHTMLELARHVGPEQARALCYATGVRVAAEHPLGNVEKLSELEIAGQRFLSERDWGWLTVDERSDAIEFTVGSSPLSAWFGASAMPWAPALFEGFFTEWLRQLGAGDRLELRQFGAVGADGALRFRLMHESQFKTGIA